MTPVDLAMSRFQVAVRVKAEAQQAYDAAFRRHMAEGTKQAWKAKMSALALLSERCQEFNLAKKAMVWAISADALDGQGDDLR